MEKNQILGDLQSQPPTNRELWDHIINLTSRLAMLEGRSVAYFEETQRLVKKVEALERRRGCSCGPQA